MALSKKEIIGGFIIAVITFVGLCIGFRYNSDEIYYQVIFDSNGGTEIAGQNILIGNQVTPPNQTTKEGYIFKGWYLGKEKYDFSTNVRKDMTLVAKWQKIEDLIEESKKEKEKNGKTEKEESKQENKKEQTNETTNNNNNNQTPSTGTTSPKQQTQQPTIVNVSGIVLNTTSITVKVGDSANLIATVQPSNATNKSVSWSSNNSQVATVINGTVRAISPGTATITATAGGKTVSCTVTVPRNLTYTYEMVDVPSSAIGQCYIYIKRSDGQRVSGTIDINYINGTTERVQVSTSGVMKVRSTIASVNVISAG